MQIILSTNNLKKLTKNNKKIKKILQNQKKKKIFAFKYEHYTN